MCGGGWQIQSENISVLEASRMVLLVNNLSAKAGDMRYGFDTWVQKIPWSRKWQLTPEFLPGKFDGQRSLSSYSPWAAES